MKLLIDMNLSPKWREVFARQGWSAVHWSTVGDPRATDQVIMDWARESQSVVLTHDLDFGMLLALTNAGGPSVIQVRAQNVVPEHLEALEHFHTILSHGRMGKVVRAFFGRGSRERGTDPGSPSGVSEITENALIVAAIQQHETLLEAGALIVVDENSSRARVLPLKR